MEKIVEATGKTIEAAIDTALEQLQVDRDKVSVEVLEKPKPGFLGLGGTLARVKVTLEESHIDRAEGYVRGLLQHMRSPARPESTEKSDGSLYIELIGGDSGTLIGRRGETLDAIQHLTRQYVNRASETPVRIIIDVEHYREKRTAALERLAQKVAMKVQREHRSVMLEPMNAYERHVIHTALQSMEGISTYSVGEDPRRQVVVACENGGTPIRMNESRGPRPGGARPSYGFGRSGPGGGERRDRFGSDRPRPSGSYGSRDGAPRPGGPGRSGPPRDGQRPPFNRDNRYGGGASRPPRPGYGNSSGGGYNGGYNGGYGGSRDGARTDNRFGGAPRPPRASMGPGPSAPQGKPPVLPKNPRPYERISPSDQTEE